MKDLTIKNLETALNHFREHGRVARKFDMGSYGGIDLNPPGDMTCKTSACLLGEFVFVPTLEPSKDDLIANLLFDYNLYSDRILPYFKNEKEYNIYWSPLFGVQNSNNWEHALDRLQLTIKLLKKANRNSTEEQYGEEWKAELKKISFKMLLEMFKLERNPKEKKVDYVDRIREKLISDILEHYENIR